MNFRKQWAVLAAAAACSLQAVPVQATTPDYQIEYVVQNSSELGYTLENGQATLVCALLLEDQNHSESVKVEGSTADSQEPVSITIGPAAEIDGRKCPVVRIAAGCWKGSCIEEVTIEASVTALEDGAFEDCSSLRKVILKNEKAMNLHAFKNCPQVQVFNQAGELLYDAAGAEPDEEEQAVTWVLNREEDNEESSTNSDLNAAEQAVVQIRTADEDEGSFYAETGWVRVGSDWKYQENGRYVTKSWRNINGSTYYFMVNGKMARGWIKLDSGWYYLNSEGALLRNQWIGNDYVGSDGCWIQNTWSSRNGLPVYQLGDGTLYKNGWKQKGSIWYWFDQSGTPAHSGWKSLGGKNYFFEPDGTMAASVWKGEYYCTGDGHAIKPGWEQNGSAYKYVNMDGSYVTGTWKEINGGVYYFGQDSVMKTGFADVNGSRYYFGTDGKARKDAMMKINGKVYYADGGGHILRVPFRLNGVRLIPDSSGAITAVAVNDSVRQDGNGYSWNEILAGGSITGEAAGRALASRLGQNTGKSLSKTIDGTTYQLLRFPMKTMNITQGANGQFTHQGVQALDLASVDSGMDQVYAPCDMHLYKTLTYERGNGMFFHSDNKVLFADGTIDYATFLFLHDSYIDDVKTSYKQWEEFSDEGIAGYATGNHCHFEVAKGHQDAYYFLNVYDVYGLRNSIPVDQACVIDGVSLMHNGQTQSSGNTMNWKYASDVYKTNGINDRPANAAEQQGKFWCTKGAIKIRKSPSTKSEQLGTLYYGEAVVYDCYVRQGGYTWLGFVNRNGERRWVASGEHDGKSYTDRYGTFE